MLNFRPFRGDIFPKCVREGDVSDCNITQRACSIDGAPRFDGIMKIIRYEDLDGSIRHAAEQPDSSYLRIEGELFGRFEVTRQEANIRRKLAPAAPSMIWCIGQNYRRHSEEVGMDVPEHPVVFAKGRNAVQAPDGPIWIPAETKSSERDYEGE